MPRRLTPALQYVVGTLSDCAVVEITRCSAVTASGYLPALYSEWPMYNCASSACGEVGKVRTDDWNPSTARFHCPAVDRVDTIPHLRRGHVRRRGVAGGATVGAPGADAAGSATAGSPAAGRVTTGAWKLASRPWSAAATAALASSTTGGRWFRRPLAQDASGFGHALDHQFLVGERFLRALRALQPAVEGLQRIAQTEHGREAAAVLPAASGSRPSAACVPCQHRRSPDEAPTNRWQDSAAPTARDFLIMLPLNNNDTARYSPPSGLRSATITTSLYQLLAREHEVRAAVLRPPGSVGRIQRQLFAVTHRAQAVGRNAQADSVRPSGRCAPVAECEIVLGRRRVRRSGLR